MKSLRAHFSCAREEPLTIGGLIFCFQIFGIIHNHLLPESQRAISKQSVSYHSDLESFCLLELDSVPLEHALPIIRSVLLPEVAVDVLVTLTILGCVSRVQGVYVFGEQVFS